MDRKEGMYLIQTFAILGGDRRQFYLASQLMASGFSVACHQVPGLPDTHPSLHAALAQAEAVLLPIPALQNGTEIRGAPGLTPASVQAALAPRARIFGGALPENLFAGHKHYDYLKDEPLAIQNAALTAEAALVPALQALPGGLAGNAVLIVGFGRIGKCLARRLQSLGAAVTVASRRAEDRAWCAALGYRPEQSGQWAHGLSQYACIFNTVPVPLFTEAQLTSLRCPFLELASAPGGLPAGAEAPEGYLAAPGLPGKFAPERAARILKETTLRILSEEQEALWNP